MPWLTRPIPRWPAEAAWMAPSIGPAARRLCANCRPWRMSHRQRGNGRARATCRRVRISRGGSCLSRRPPRRSGAAGRCYRKCMELADERAVRTISFPAISTGIYGYPQKAAAEIAIREVRRHLTAGQWCGAGYLRALRRGSVRGVPGDPGGERSSQISLSATWSLPGDSRM